MAEIWYYAEQDETKGPLSLDELALALKRQPRADKVFVWREGYKDWVRAGDVPELSRFFVRPPPLRQTVPSPRPPEFKPPTETATRGWKGWVANLVGAAIGLVLSKVFGMTFWLPALGILAAYWALTKIKIASPIVSMLSVLIGHTLWMGVGHAVLWSANKPNSDLAGFSVDLVVVVALTLWCVKRESSLSCFAVLAYQGLCLVGTIYEFEDIEKASVAAAFMHLLLRVTGACAAVYAAVKIRKLRQQEGIEALGTGPP
ncbi:MAG: DUF4339 domain-containing protein [Pseudomonadota bacterium]|jgi:hypothetical protein